MGDKRGTVRRKVLTLQKKGWVHRCEDGMLSISPEVAPPLADAIRDAIAHLEKICCTVETAHEARKRARDGEQFAALPIIAAC